MLCPIIGGCGGGDGWKNFVLYRSFRFCSQLTSATMIRFNRSQHNRLTLESEVSAFNVWLVLLHLPGLRW